MLASEHRHHKLLRRPRTPADPTSQTYTIVREKARCPVARFTGDRLTLPAGRGEGGWEGPLSLKLRRELYQIIGHAIELQRGEVVVRFRNMGYVAGRGRESLRGIPFDVWGLAQPPGIRKQREARTWWPAPPVFRLLSLLPASGAGGTTVSGRAARCVRRLYRSCKTERDHSYQQNCSDSLHGFSPF